MIEGIGYSLDLIAILLWVIGICQIKVKRGKIKWVALATALAGNLLLPLICQDEREKLLISLFLMIFSYSLFVQEKWIKKIVVYMFSVFYVNVLYGPISFLFEIIDGKKKNSSFVTEIVESLLVIFCILILTKQICKRKEWVDWIKEIPNKYYLLGFICAFSASGLTEYVNMYIQYSSKEIQVIVTCLTTVVNIFLYLIGIATVFINLLMQHYKEESILKDEYLRLSELHYESMSEKMKEMRRLKHDIKAHLKAITFFLEKGEKEKLEKYIESTNEAIDKSMGEVINVNHDLINAILTETLMSKKDIQFQSEGMIPSNIIVEDFDLCTIFYNLISNSIEACERLKTLEKEIMLQIKRFQSNLIIYIENPVEGDVEIEKLGKWTIKKDRNNHGYGIYNVIKTVEKYNGEIRFQCENSRFSVEIIFLNSLN